MGAQETSDSFNDEVLREQDVFNLAKRAEMKVRRALPKRR